MQILLVGLFLFFNTLQLEAKDLGVKGHVFKIEEQNLLLVIQKKLSHLQATGELSLHQELISNKIKQNIIHKNFIESILVYEAFKSDKGIERNAFVTSLSFYNIFVLLEQNRYISKDSIEQYCRENLQESDKKIVDAYIKLRIYIH